MAKYLDCTIQNGVGPSASGTGTPSDPYVLMTSAYAGTATGETLYVKTTEAMPYKGNGVQNALQVQDVKGITVKPAALSSEAGWSNANSVVHIDATLNSNSYVWRLEHVDSKISFFDISGSAVNKFAIRINANIADDGFTDCFIHDGGSDGVLTGSGITADVNVFRNKIYRMRMGWRIEGLTSTFNMHQCQERDLTLYNRVNAASGAAVTYNCFNNAGGSAGWYVQAGDITDYGSITIGGGKNAGQAMVLNEGAGDCVKHGGLVTYPVLDSGSFNLGFSNTGAGTNTFDAGVKGPAADAGKIFRTGRRKGMVCFIRDDIEAYVTDGVFAGEWDSWLDALEARGLKGTYPMSTREGDNVNAVSAAGWADVKAIVDRGKGHELSTHGCTGYHVQNDDFLTVVNTSGTCELTIANNTVTSINATSGNDLNIDMSVAPYKLTDLIAAIDAVVGWTAVIVTTGGSSADAAPARILADVTSLNVGTVKTLSQDTLKAYEYEYLLCRQDIFDNTGYTAKTHIYSSGGYNAAMSGYMFANGWLAGRLGAALVSPYNDQNTGVYKFPATDAGYDPMQAFGLLTANYLDTTTDETLRRSVQAVCHWAMYHGAAVPFYAHEYAEFSLAEWEVLFDAVKETGIDTGTFSDLGAFMNNPPTVSNTTDDAWEPYLVQGTSYPASSFIGGSGGTGEQSIISHNIIKH
jgi:hypothetical protein